MFALFYTFRYINDSVKNDTMIVSEYILCASERALELLIVYS